MGFGGGGAGAGEGKDGIGVVDRNWGREAEGGRARATTAWRSSTSLAEKPCCLTRAISVSKVCGRMGWPWRERWDF